MGGNLARQAWEDDFRVVGFTGYGGAFLAEYSENIE